MKKPESTFRRHKATLAVAMGTIAASIVIAVGWKDSADPSSSEVAYSINYGAYEGYSFGDSDEVIDLGTQPLYAPTGLITETMRRDLLLLRELHSQGLEIRFHSFFKGADVNAYLGYSELEAGIGGDMPAITAAATQEIVIPLMVQQGFTSIIAKHPLVIRELAGKRIGCGFGSCSHFALLDALASVGFGESDIRWVFMETNELPGAMLAGKIDAFSSWEPIPTLILANLPHASIVHQQLTTGYLYFSSELLNRRPDAVYQVSAAVLRAVNWLHEDFENLRMAAQWNLDAMEKLAGHSIGLSVDQVVDLAQSDILGSTAPLAIPGEYLRDDGPLSREHEFLVRLGKIPESSSWDSTRGRFDLKIVHRLRIESRGYQLWEYDYATEGIPDECL